MDWEQYLGYLQDALLSWQGLFSVIGGLFITVCGATAVHFGLEVKARTVWSPFGVALLAYAGFWLGTILATSVVTSGLEHNPYLDREMLGMFTFFLSILAVVVIAIWRGYACSWAQAGGALLRFCVAAFVATMVVLVFAPNYMAY